MWSQQNDSSEEKKNVRSVLIEYHLDCVTTELWNTLWFDKNRGGLTFYFRTKFAALLSILRNCVAWIVFFIAKYICRSQRTVTIAITSISLCFWFNRSIDSDDSFDQSKRQQQVIVSFKRSLFDFSAHTHTLYFKQFDNIFSQTILCEITQFKVVILLLFVFEFSVCLNFKKFSLRAKCVKTKTIHSTIVNGKRKGNCANRSAKFIP